MGELREDAQEDLGVRKGDRRASMIEAAEELFLENGFEQTSLAAIVKRSGGSLTTLYELFGNKQGLLRALVSARKAESQMPVCSAGMDRHCQAEFLVEFGKQLHRHMTAPRITALMRMTIVEGLRDPAFARQIYEEMHVHSVRDLASVFAVWTEDGTAEIDDPMAAAELFFAIVGSDAQLHAILGAELGWSGHGQIEWRLAPFLSHFKISRT